MFVVVARGEERGKERRVELMEAFATTTVVHVATGLQLEAISPYRTLRLHPLRLSRRPEFLQARLFGIGDAVRPPPDRPRRVLG
jgi:hypothetical protein